MSERENHLNALHARIATLNGSLLGARDELTGFLGELRSLPGALRQALEQAKSVLDERAGVFEASARELAASLGERSNEVLERTGQTAAAEFAELQGFVSEDFLDKVRECYETNVATVCEACSEMRDNMDEQLEEFVDATKEQVTGLSATLDDFGSEWKEAVSNLGGDYREVCERISSLGDDVAALTDAMDTALQSTAVGMNAAAQSIDDIKAIMAGVV